MHGVVSAESRSKRRNAILACGLGNLFEVFDFTVYGFLAVPISEAFFPGADKTASLLKGFVTFGVGFLMRPVGAAVFGSYSDRIGRTQALVVCFTMMAISTFLTGVLPSFATIGVAAPLILVALRMVQGFSAGGAMGATTSFFIEHAQPGRRGFMGSMQQISNQLGAIVGSLMAALIAGLVSKAAFLAWGWRIPFLIGILPLFVGLYLRAFAEEPSIYQRSAQGLAERSRPLLNILKRHKGGVAIAFLISIVGVVYNFSFNVFLTNLAITKLGIAPSAAFWCTTAAGVLGMVLAPIAGHFSDRIGRRPFVLAVGFGLLVLSYPLFAFVTRSHGSVTDLLIVQLITAAIHAGYVGVLPSLLAERFPTRVRTTAVALSYSPAVAIFGGFAPFAATLLVERTHQLTSPAYLVGAAALVSLLAALFTRDHSKAVLD